MKVLQRHETGTTTTQTNIYKTPLCQVVHSNAPLIKIKQLIESGDHSINGRDGLSRWTPLLVAAVNGQRDITEYLLLHGADTTMRTSRRRNAVMLAALHGHHNLVVDLLAQGAVLNSTDFEGLTALMLAVIGNHYKCVVILLAHGAELEKKERNGKTAKQIALDKGYWNIATLIEDEEKNRGQ